MASTKVQGVIDSARLTLIDSGVHWSNSELITYLNEAYQALITLKPGANPKNEPLDLVAGTKQSLPASGLTLLDVVRNLLPNKESITIVSKRQLDIAVPNWHESVVDGIEGSPLSGIEHYVYDDNDPKIFYVYPGALGGCQVEIKYSAEIGSHPLNGETVPDETIKVDDIYLPALVSYVLYRAFNKETPATKDVTFALTHLKSFENILTGRTQLEAVTSPNAAQAR